MTRQPQQIADPSVDPNSPKTGELTYDPQQDNSSKNKQQEDLSHNQPNFEALVVETKEATETKEEIEYPDWHPDVRVQNVELHESIQKSDRPIYSEPSFDCDNESNQFCKSIYSNISSMDLETS